MDITHDNVCSSMLSCFYSHLLSTGRPISSSRLLLVMEVLDVKTTYRKSCAPNLLVGSDLTLDPSFKVECGP